MPDQVREPVAPRTVFRWAVAAALGVLAVWLAAMAVYTVRSVLVLVLIFRPTGIFRQRETKRA